MARKIPQLEKTIIILPTVNTEFSISIIVPMLNEITELPVLLEHLQYWRQKGCEVVLVDGGSCDGSMEAAKKSGFTVLRSECGRARQLNTGAASARGNVLLFLHADTRLPQNADQLINIALIEPGKSWGRFDVRIAGEGLLLRSVSYFINMRSRYTGIATGDQAIFVSQAAFKNIGGFPLQPLMEDVEISHRLLQVSRPICLQDKVSTSARRWQTRGVYRTILLMWQLRWAYWRGVSPERLAKRYQ